MRIISEIPILYIFIIALLSAGLTWYFFIHQHKWSELKKTIRYSIYLLRFSILLLIGILLLGLFVERIKSIDEKPILLTLVDHSSSMLNYKDSSEVKSNIAQLIAGIEASHPKFEKKFYAVGSELKNQKELRFDEAKTNLSTAFDQIFTDYYNRNIGGIILISDGNYNEGQHPVYSASKIPFTPIFTVGVGDTSLKFDQLMKDVVCNEIAFLNHKFPVQLNIEATRLASAHSKVNLYQNGKLVASKEITYKSETDFQQVVFELEANAVGFQQFRAEVVPIKDEYTTKNNSIRFYVEVLDAKNKILLLSGAPHPDISALKSVFEQDKNVQVEYKSVDKWDRNLKNIDLIIWHEPGINFSDEINRLIQSSKISLLYFIGINTSQQVARKLDIGLELPGNNQTDEVQASFNPDFNVFEVEKNAASEIEKFPPLIVRYGQARIGKQNQVLIRQKIATVAKTEALCYFGSNENSKYGVFLGEGIWKWKMANYVKSKNNQLFNDFFTKINQYLVQKKNTSNLRVNLPKRCLKNENILIKAEFYNEAMELITKPKISFQLSDTKGKKSALEFGVSNQSYLLQLGRLKAGVYHWKAYTEFSGKKYQKAGSFVVEDIQLEKLDTRANHHLLNQLSENTKGKFYPLKKWSNLLHDLEKREDIVTISYQQNQVDPILDFLSLLFLLLIFLTTEWFLKRWNGYY